MCITVEPHQTEGKVEVEMKHYPGLQDLLINIKMEPEKKGLRVEKFKVQKHNQKSKLFYHHCPPCNVQPIT